VYLIYFFLFIIIQQDEINREQKEEGQLKAYINIKKIVDYSIDVISAIRANKERDSCICVMWYQMIKG
jgi:hypothetical protein